MLINCSHLNRLFLMCFQFILLSLHASQLAHSPDLMLPSSRMTPPQRVYMERLLASLSLSPSLFSSSCFSLIFSQFLRRNTLCFSTKFLMMDEEDRSVKMVYVKHFSQHVKWEFLLTENLIKSLYLTLIWIPKSPQILFSTTKCTSKWQIVDTAVCKHTS